MSPKLEALIEYLRANPPAQILCGLHHRHDLDDSEAQQMVDALECWSIVEQLREHEGAVLEIVCPNPDFNGLPNEVVDITDDWTGWKPRRFGGHSLLEALRAAKTVRDIMVRVETDAHGRERKPR